MKNRSLRGFVMRRQPLVVPFPDLAGFAVSVCEF
jgi:hypothetical protein